MLTTETMTAPKRATTFSYTAQERVYTALHVSHAAPRARILLMPDGEGMHTGWAQRISCLYADTCHAEVILTDHYGADCTDPSVEQAAAINQRLYNNPIGTRELFKNLVMGLIPHWTAGGPLIVIGFCSGGAFAFETGRSGAPVDAVFSIHGDPASAAPITCNGPFPIFSMVHGSLDPFISQASLSQFTREMQEYQVEWNLHLIGNAKHSFTRFDRAYQNYGMAYSRRAEIAARHLVLAQILSFLEDQD